LVQGKEAVRDELFSAIKSSKGKEEGGEEEKKLGHVNKRRARGRSPKAFE